MPRLTRIYTRTGDDGTTALVGGGRVKKNALRIETYGTADELSSAIGVARAALADVLRSRALDQARAVQVAAQLDAWLAWTQDVLFNLGAHHRAAPGAHSRRVRRARAAGPSDSPVRQQALRRAVRLGALDQSRACRGGAFVVRRFSSSGLKARLFARAPIDRLGEDVSASGAGRAKLRRKLGAIDLVSVGLGTMIGGGIFTTIGPGVQKAGPAIVVAFLLAGLASFFAALAYAELGAMVPIAGSAYTYAYATLGEIVAWIIGWDLILEYGISAAPVAQQFSSYAQSALEAFG